MKAKKKFSIPDKFRCSKCNSSQTYVTIKGIRKCRTCGYRQKVGK